jgi:DNA-directed RNA polymerase specialized sigma24 family protein
MPKETSRASGPVDRGSDPDFDDFYLTSRRRLVLSAYALTGDLAAARGAVADAYVAARHHWHKVGGLTDPEEWVRPRAWTVAQRRHVGRLWHRDTGIDTDQEAVLDALHHLPDQQRKVLLLARLAGLSTADIGRELGASTAHVEQRLESATAAFCRATGGTPAHVQASIESLAPIAEAAALPDLEVVDHRGRRRRLLHTVGGGLALVALAVLGGLFVVGGGVRGEAGSAAGTDAHPVTGSMLLSLPQVQQLAPKERWRLLGTSDNTSGTGINSVCQAARFADPRGEGTLVRTFVTEGPADNRRRVVQTVEISRSPHASRSAYRTTLGWFAGCSKARLQLLNAYRVHGLGEEAQMLKLRIPNALRRTYVVGVARTGSLTVSTVSETLGGNPVDVQRAVTTLSEAVRDVCSADASGPCPGAVRAAPVLPPPSGEVPGTLATADLPVIRRINRPWVGTRPVPARPNIAATTCDKADFVRSGAPRATTRTFLIPEARLPRRFGIAQTVGSFPSPGGAHAFVHGISSAMARCEHKDLGAEVSKQVVQRRGYRGSEYAMWRLDSEINDRSSVGFWMGVARVGRYVAQVNFTPAGDDDIDEDTFQALISRARDRLFELPASGPVSHP